MLHGQPALDVARPSGFRFVPIQLDPVLVGVAQTQRLADPIFGRTSGWLKAMAAQFRDGLVSSPGEQSQRAVWRAVTNRE